MNKIIKEICLECTPRRDQCRRHRVRHSHDWTLCRSELFDVADLSCCSADDRREVVKTILMFTWGTQVWPPGCRERRRSATRFGHREVEDVVVWGASEQSREDAPQIPNSPLSRAGSLCRSELFDVADLSCCSADDCREVVETILMFTWGTQVRSPGSRGHRRWATSK